ncbi:MAG: DUF2950 domain-containing protein [Gammaproteobacteria bacterium]|nr:DUF2950 domain-containing protein [Gammaproteobacteria bacterium]
MDYHLEEECRTVIKPTGIMDWSHLKPVIAGVILCLVSYAGFSQKNMDPVIDPGIGQAVFESPEAAANTFLQAVENGDRGMLGKLLGADYRVVLPLDEVDSEDVQNFIVAWKKRNTLVRQNDQEVLIAVGEGEWTFPIPIVAGSSGWRFDTEKGRERMRIRRIGRNELATIQAVLAYHDAQIEYAEQDRNHDGVLEYARKFISSPGSRDGLYWEAATDEAQSPLGPLFSDNTPEGAYHGYYYRILEAQGTHGKNGVLSYIQDGRMTRGFGLVAWPAEYGESGVMSFIINHEGGIYEQDLGSDSANTALEMKNFNPEPGWQPVQDLP